MSQQSHDINDHGPTFTFGMAAMEKKAKDHPMSEEYLTMAQLLHPPIQNALQSKSLSLDEALVSIDILLCCAASLLGYTIVKSGMSAEQENDLFEYFLKHFTVQTLDQRRGNKKLEEVRANAN